LEKAFKLYVQSSNMGCLLAKNMLGSYYFNYKKDFNKASKFFREAAQNNECIRAVNNLAVCFEMGLGDAEKDYNKAI